MTRGSREDVDIITFQEVIELSKEQEIFIIGGGEIYGLFLPTLTRFIVQQFM